MIRFDASCLRLLAMTAGVLVAMACHQASYACASHDDCVDGDQSGTCESSGYCSFPDPTCPSERRYGEFAGTGLANACVPDEVAEGGPTTTIGGETSGSATSTEETSAVVGSSGTTSDPVRTTELATGTDDVTSGAETDGIGCIVESFDNGVPDTWATDTDLGAQVIDDVGSVHLVIEGDGAPRYASISQLESSDFNNLVIELDVLTVQTTANIGTVSLQLNTSEDTPQRYAFVISGGATCIAEDFNDMDRSTVQQSGPLPVAMPTHWRVTTREGGALWELSDDGMSWTTIYDGDVPVDWSAARLRFGSGTWADGIDPFTWTIDEVRVCPAQ